MTDLSAVKTGDRLKVDCLVTETDLTSRIWCLRVGDDDTVLIEKAALEEAAEHIPAPRVFKRGDWVCFQNGNVVQMVVADDVDDELVWVTSDNPAQNILWRKQDCELTEAPE